MEPTDAPLMLTKAPTDAPVALSTHEPTAEPTTSVAKRPSTEPAASTSQGSRSPTRKKALSSSEPTAYVHASSEPTAYVRKSPEPTAYAPKSSEPTAYVKASVLPTHSPAAEAKALTCDAELASATHVVAGVSYPLMGCSTFFWEDEKSSEELFATFCTCRELGQLDVPLSLFAYPKDSPDPTEYPHIHTIVSGWNTSMTVEAPYVHGSTSHRSDYDGLDRLVIGPREVTTIEKLERVAGSGAWTGDVKSIKLMGWNYCGNVVDCDDVAATLKRRVPKVVRNRSRRRLFYV